jgi:S1-C subfamily serine protease
VTKLSNRFSKLLLIGLALVLSGFSGAWLQAQTTNNDALPSVSEQKKIVAGQGQLISRIAREAGASVVSINVTVTSQPAVDAFGFVGPAGETQASGTGIIISDKGLVVTNRHVVPVGTTSVSVILSDGTELKNVSVVGRTGDNDSLDVAFLKINDIKAHKLAAAKLGDSSNVQVGDNVVAIGNALGLFQNSVTSGIISGFGRRVQAGDSSGNPASTELLDNLFQTDAAINQGNSGGPLVNLNGQVVGINTAVAGGAQNIGFAIPINDVRGLVDQVLKTGKFERPYLGVRYIPLTADVAAEFGLKTRQGAFIPPVTDPANPTVIPDSPADRAGLKERDIITAVDGVKIDERHSLASQLGRHKPGDKVRLEVLRGSKTIRLTTTLDKVPGA